MDDLIRRDDAIMAIKRLCMEDGTPQMIWSSDATDALKRVSTMAMAVHCCECEHWDNDSGLSVRMCSMWGTYTKQLEWCCRAKGRDCNV